MEKIFLKRTNQLLKGQSVLLSASKSESNRLLLINSLAVKRMELQNLSTARDTQTMQSLLAHQPAVWDVKDAGTTMRFLTAYLSLHGYEAVITGTERMKERPIGPLVYCLRTIGADISYFGKEGYPPLKISKVTDQKSNAIEIPGNISSQYISALLMIAPLLPKGLHLHLTTEVFSKPYIDMTLKLMSKYGVSADWDGSNIRISPQTYSALENSYKVESDWSGASYWYSLVAMGGGELFLENLRSDSTQGDQVIAQIMKHFGVETTYENNGVHIRSSGNVKSELVYDFRECPDLAQTVLVVAAVLGTHMEMTGLESLKIKETDRVAALQTELAKLGASLIEEKGRWTLIPSSQLPEAIEVKTYEDHRMAMAFAPLCMQMDVTVNDPAVVRKSYPEYWDELQKVI